MKKYSSIFILTILSMTAFAWSAMAAAPTNDNLASAQNLGSALNGSVQGTNVEATSETDEPSHYTQNPSIQSVWYKWTATTTRSMAFEELDNGFKSTLAIYSSTVASPTFAQLTKVETCADLQGFNYNGCRINFWAQSGKTYYIVVDYSNAGGQGGQTGNFELKYYPNALAYSTRMDSRDHKASPFVFRPSNNMWYFLYNIYYPGYETIYGKTGDTPVPADYNGDGRTDIALARNENGAKVWYVGFQTTTIWGLPTDKPLIGDFDNDGRADFTAVRSNGQNLIWYVRRSTDASMMAFSWGIPTDKPVIGDFDGDGITDVTVTRATPNGLVWHILKSNGGSFNQSASLQFGINSDVVAIEDYDGDGKSDIAVFRPADGMWYILRSGTNQVQATQFGASGDKPQPADYDGDGKADLGLFRDSEGKWYVWMSGTNTQKSRDWGTPGDIPITSLNSLSQ
jgi:hypothetical protein